MGDINIKTWKMANEVYASVAQLSAAEALAQLETLPDLTEEVKAVVITLINSGDQSSQYFREQVSNQFHVPSAHIQQWKAGDLLAGYELLEEVGQGGMSQVFKGQRIGSEVQKMVAIKVFAPRQQTQQLLDHFLTEQSILSGLSHKHIVAMHHGGTTEEGVSFMVMELIEQAAPIDQYVKTHNTPLKNKVQMVRDAAEAISYAHNNLIIHRDIKPSNVLLDAQGELKIVDFGIAKLIQNERTEDKTTLMALTPSFAAPEQINNQKIGVYTDIFSLAALMLSLVTGKLPFPKDRLLKSCATDETYLWQQLKSASCDSDLKNIINKALQSNPEKRYQTMHAFSEDLGRWLDDEPVTATKDSWLYRIKKFATRRSALFASLITLVVTAALGITGLAWQYQKTVAEAEKAEQVKSFMLGVFASTNPDVNAGQSISAIDLLKQAGEDLEKRDFADTDVQADMFSAMGTAHMQLGSWDKANDYLQKAKQLDIDNSDSSLRLIELSIKQENYGKARDELQLLSDKEGGWLNSPQWQLLNSQVDSGFANNDSALTSAESAFASFQQQGELSNILKSGLHLARVKSDLSKDQEALELLNKLYQQGSEGLSETNTQMINIQLAIQRSHNTVGNYQEALTIAEKISTDITQLLGAEHPSLYQVWLEKASTYRATGKVEEARELADRTHQLTITHFGPDHPATGRALNMQAAIDYVEGKREEALLKATESARIFDQAFGEDHPETWLVKSNVATYLEMLDRTKEAIGILEALLQTQKNSAYQDKSEMIFTQVVLVRSYLFDDQKDKALALAKRSLDESVELYGNNHVLTADAFFVLAKTYEAVEQYPEALATILKIKEYGLIEDNNEKSIAYYNNLGSMYQLNELIEDAKTYKLKSLQIARELLGDTGTTTILQSIRTIDFLISVESFDEARGYYAGLKKALEEQPSDNPRVISRVEKIETALNDVATDGS